MKYNLNWLTHKFDSGESIEYIFFWGHAAKHGESIGKFIFSQWYPSAFIVDGITYKTAEHWMMAQKASLFDEPDIFNKIIASDKPGEVKALGRAIRNFDELQWDKWKYDIVRTGSIHKFHQNKTLRDYLLATGDKVIVEASPSDFIWGIGLSQDEKMVENPYVWRGTNLLGFALMEARDFLRSMGEFGYISGFLPPWKKFPGINPTDMFWRMGVGEDYIIQYSKYFLSLSEREKTIYKLSYPTPNGDWAGYYE
ncbi:MAG TPA: NADAR family protein [Ohtaekwangia sp.]|uniref:NADAR family protein n=1 Tax=Ohtaekwangia sp. TaxID=2066019 RepID=UPI002F92600D